MDDNYHFLVSHTPLVIACMFLDLTYIGYQHINKYIRFIFLCPNNEYAYSCLDYIRYHDHDEILVDPFLLVCSHYRIDEFENIFCIYFELE